MLKQDWISWKKGLRNLKLKAIQIIKMILFIDVEQEELLDRLSIWLLIYANACRLNAELFLLLVGHVHMV
jgi:hypothetical protein